MEQSDQSLVRQSEIVNKVLGCSSVGSTNKQLHSRKQVNGSQTRKQIQKSNWKSSTKITSNPNLKLKSSAKLQIKKQQSAININPKQKFIYTQNLSTLQKSLQVTNQSIDQLEINSMRSQGSNEQWNRQSQIGTRSRIMRQYERYFDDVQNVFYEDTALMKQLQTIRWCWKLVLFLFIVNISFWLLIWSISPYPKSCPRHATCGAYIQCHQGYVLDRQYQICQVDPQISQFALALMNSVIQDMKFEYGEKECNIPKNATQQQVKQYLEPPRQTLYQIFNKLDIQTEEFEVLRTELTKNFKDQNNQLLGKFGRDSANRFYPLEKTYSITCKIDKFYRHNFKTFIFIVLISIVLLILGSLQLSSWLFYKKGQRIYQFMKTKTVQNNEIHYEDYQAEIIETFNRNKPISKQLWLLINDFRIKEKTIGCYQMNEGREGIVWRALGSL